MVERLAALLDEVEQFPAAAITLRLGWGTGWRTMTGNILTPEERDRVIRVGKTRKVIIDGHAARGAACDVFGWVRIEPISGAEAAVVARATRPATVQPPKLAAPQPPVQASAAAPMGLPPRDAFAQRLQGLKSRDWGLVAGLVKEAASHTDPAERERRLRLLADQFTATFGGDRKRMRQLAEMAEIAPYLKRK